MVVDKHDEYYLIHSMGLTKKQIKEMLPSEVENHCKNVIKKEIEETGIYNPNNKHINEVKIESNKPRRKKSE